MPLLIALSFLHVLTLAGDVLSEHPSFQKGLAKPQSLWKWGKRPSVNDSPALSQPPCRSGFPSSVDLGSEALTGSSLVKGKLLDFCKAREEQTPGDGKLTFDGHSGIGYRI